MPAGRLPRLLKKLLPLTAASAKVDAPRPATLRVTTSGGLINRTGLFTSSIALAGLVITGTALGAVAAPTPPPNTFVTGHVASGRAVLDEARGTASLAEPQPVSGAAVQLVWLPHSDLARPGQEIKPVIVAGSRTDTHGRYELVVVPGRALVEEAQRNGGWANFDLVTRTRDGEVVSEGIARRWTGEDWALDQDESPDHLTPIGRDEAGQMTNASHGAASSETDLERSASAAVAAGQPGVSTAAASEGTTYAASSESLDSGETVDAGSVSIDEVAVGTAAGNGGTVPCSFITTGTGKKMAKLAWFHNTSDFDSSWEYGESADTDVSVGIDYNGDGGWTTSGTAHSGNDFGSKIGNSATGDYHNYPTSYFKYIQGYYKPYGQGDYCDNGIPVWTKKVTVRGWAGGVNEKAGAFKDCSDSPRKEHRVWMSKGSFFEKTSTNARSISGAVSFSFIQLGGQSGFSSYLQLHWKAAQGGGYICGYSDYPAGTPGIIYTQN